MASISYTIESSYFLLLSTGIYKRAGLLWEQRVGGSNPSAPTIDHGRAGALRSPRFRSAPIARRH